MKQPVREPFGTLGWEIKKDVWKRNLDAKIIITSHNSRPGLGKTTLAILMARDFDRNNWSAEDKAFLDAHKYHNAYEDLESGSVLLFDEIEGEADNRRSMSDKNVELSQAWAQNRYRNMITICTLPSVSMLDKRMLEMSDYWINVMRRGVAHPYKVFVNDYTGSVYRDRMGSENDAVIQFDDLPSDDTDKQLLDKKKHDRRSSTNQQYYSEKEHQEELEKARKQQEMEIRNEFIRRLKKDSDLSVDEIAGLFDLSQPRVSQISNAD